MDVALVRHVEKDLVVRRTEGEVEGDGELDHPEVGTEVAAVASTGVDQLIADLLA